MKELEDIYDDEEGLTESNEEQELNIDFLCSNMREIDNLQRYRMMVLIHSIRDIPCDLDGKKKYYLEYIFLNQKIKYELDLS